MHFQQLKWRERIFDMIEMQILSFLYSKHYSYWTWIVFSLIFLWNDSLFRAKKKNAQWTSNEKMKHLIKSVSLFSWVQRERELFILNKTVIIYLWVFSHHFLAIHIILFFFLLLFFVSYMRVCCVQISMVWCMYCISRYIMERS